MRTHLPRLALSSTLVAAVLLLAGSGCYSTPAVPKPTVVAETRATAFHKLGDTEVIWLRRKVSTERLFSTGIRAQETAEELLICRATQSGTAKCVPVQVVCGDLQVCGAGTALPVPQTIVSPSPSTTPLSNAQPPAPVRPCATNCDEIAFAATLSIPGFKPGEFAPLCRAQCERSPSDLDRCFRGAGTDETALVACAQASVRLASATDACTLSCDRVVWARGRFGSDGGDTSARCMADCPNWQEEVHSCLRAATKSGVAKCLRSTGLK